MGSLLRLSGDGQEELELGRELVLGIESVGEVNTSDSAVGVDLHSQGLDVVGTVGSPGEVRQVELDLVPALVQTHGHGTDEGLDSGGRLVVGSSESPPDALVVQNLHLEGEVLLQVLDDHDQEGQLDGQGLLGVKRSVDVVGRDVGAHDLQHGGLDVGVGDSFNVTVSDLLVPDLQGLRSKDMVSGERWRVIAAESTAWTRGTYPME